MQGRTVTVHASITALSFFLRRGYRLLRPQTVWRWGVALNNFVLEKSIPVKAPAMRRSERLVARPEEAFAVISRCKVLRLALNVPGGAPYIVPVNFGWEEADGMPVFYLHCAREGRKLDLLRLDARVGFELDGAHALKRGDVPCAYSCFYESVVGAGRVEFIDGAEEKARALERIMAQQTGEAIPVSSAQAQGVIVLRLRAEAWSCKKNAPRAQRRSDDERAFEGGWRLCLRL